MKKCEVCNMTEEETRIISSRKFNRVLCRKHLLQMTRHGKILDRTIYDPNNVRIEENKAFIELYNKNGEHISDSEISLESVEKCLKVKWYKRTNGYVYGTIDGKKVQLHRFVMGENIEGYEIDHIDGNPLNNSLSNLRKVTHKENLRNIHKTKTVGVNYNKHNGKYKWIPRIMVDGKSIWLGTYNTKEEAVLIRKQAEEKYFI